MRTSKSDSEPRTCVARRKAHRNVVSRAKVVADALKSVKHHSCKSSGRYAKVNPPQTTRRSAGESTLTHEALIKGPDIATSSQQMSSLGNCNEVLVSLESIRSIPASLSSLLFGFGCVVGVAGASSRADGLRKGGPCPKR